MTLTNIKSNLKTDILSGFVVFLIAVPLCLGIALASGAPLFAGMISGIVGGLVIGSLSKSPLSVSGPAAGLTAICLAGITSLGSFELFLMATVLAGGIQLLLSVLKAGSIAYYFPSNVIKGMLTGIGIIIILKQIPHLVGYDKDTEGDLAFFQADGENSFSSIFSMLSNIHPGAAIIGIACLIVIFAWDKLKPARLKLIPGALIAVVLGVILNQVYIATAQAHLVVMDSHMVNLPVFESTAGLISQLSFPDWTGIFNKEVWIVAFTLGIVASLETLLTIEATDKIDPLKRVTPTNRELLAQGTGNIISGLIGGLPLTSVIVRSTANLNAGAQSKLSTIIHGLILLLGVLFFANQLNNIPLASLAAILIATGYKLANPALFKGMFSKSKYQWLPFVITVVAIVLTNLLTGVMIGLAFSILSILIGNIKHSYFFKSEEYQDGKLITILLAEEVSFLNKAAIRLTLDKLPPNSKVLIDASHATYIDHDVVEIIKEFQTNIVKSKNISLILKGFTDHYNIQNNDHIFYSEIPDPLKKLEAKKEFFTQAEALNYLS